VTKNNLKINQGLKGLMESTDYLKIKEKIQKFKGLTVQRFKGSKVKQFNSSITTSSYHQITPITIYN